MQTIEQKISDIIEELLKDLGLELVRLSLKGFEHKILEILIDKVDDTGVTITDCQIASRNISAIMDLEDLISEKYSLQVSSAGVERPLVKFSDYIKFITREVNIRLSQTIDGKTKYQGIISNAENDKIYLKSEGKEVVIPFDLIKKASLVFTDEMFRNLIKKS